MTRKHFNAIADLFAAQVATADGETKATLHLLASELAGIFRTTNPLFDRGWFITACGF